MIGQIVTIGFSVGALFLLWRLFFAGQQDFLPDYLRNATLVFNEKDLQARLADLGGIVLNGRPDRVYLATNGLHVPLDFKTRGKFTVYDTDRVELSLQAFLLRRNGLKTANHGYITVQSQGNRRSMKVDLLHDSQCLALINRCIGLQCGDLPATPPSNLMKCRICRHRGTCHGKPRHQS